MLEYWTGPKHDYQYPRNVRFESKLDTDLFEFARRKTVPRALSFSPDGRLFATVAADRKVRCGERGRWRAPAQPGQRWTSLGRTA